MTILIQPPPGRLRWGGRSREACIGARVSQVPKCEGSPPLTRACLRGPRTWGTRLKGVDAPISWSLVSGFRYAIDGRPGELLPEHATRARDR
jgi:hypothetical protein